MCPYNIHKQGSQYFEHETDHLAVFLPSSIDLSSCYSRAVCFLRVSPFLLAVAFADDRSALLAMHYASNGHAWYRRDGRRWTGWIETSPLDEWSGVAVGEGRAVILNLYMCNLMGECTHWLALDVFAIFSFILLSRYP